MSDSSFFATQSCSHTDYSDNAEIMTLLLDRKSTGDYEEASGSDLLLQLLANSSTDPKEAPEMSPNHSTHHTTSSE